MEATDKMSLVERAFRQLQAEGKVRTQGCTLFVANITKAVKWIQKNVK